MSSIERIGMALRQIEETKRMIHREGQRFAGANLRSGPQVQKGKIEFAPAVFLYSE